MTKKRGIRYLSYNGTGYCPKCGIWGRHELWQSYLTNIYTVGSCLHGESIEGYWLNYRRCWY